MQFFDEKRELSKKLNKMEDKRKEQIGKLDQKLNQSISKEEKEGYSKKREKNMEKMFKY